MRIKRPLTSKIITFSFFITTTVFAQNSIPNTDTQFWTENQFFAPELIENTNLGFINFTRIGYDITEATDRRYGGLLTYKFAKEFNITLMGLHLTQTQVGTPKREQDRAILDFTGTIPESDFLNFTYRARFEKQFRYNQENSWDLRPRVGIEFPQFFGDAPEKPFIMIEGFYRTSTEQWDRIRNLIGVNFPVNEQSSFDLYIGNQINRLSGNADFDIIGLTLRVYI